MRTLPIILSLTISIVGFSNKFSDRVFLPRYVESSDIQDAIGKMEAKDGSGKLFDSVKIKYIWWAPHGNNPITQFFGHNDYRSLFFIGNKNGKSLEFHCEITIDGDRNWSVKNPINYDANVKISNCKKFDEKNWAWVSDPNLKQMSMIFPQEVPLVGRREPQKQLFLDEKTSPPESHQQ